MRPPVLIVATILLVAGCGGAAATPSATPPAPASASAAIATSGSTTPTVRPSRTPRPTGPPATDLGTRLVATIDGVAKPCAMAATATDVWVTGNAPSRLVRIDPRSNKVLTQTPTDGSPCGIAVGPDGRLWVALLSVGRVVAYDPATAKVVATIDGLGTDLWDLKAGFGAIWVADRTKRELVRIDPATATVTAHIAIGRSASGLAIAGGSVWVVDDLDGAIRRVDPVTNAVSATVTLARGASWFADDGRVLLVDDRLGGSITPIDTSATTAGVPIGGGTGPLDGTVVGGHAYIPDGSAHTLIDVDLTTGSIGEVLRLDGARNPFVAEPAFGDVWVLDYGGQRIWRIRPS